MFSSIFIFTEIVFISLWMLHNYLIILYSFFLIPRRAAQLKSIHLKSVTFMRYPCKIGTFADYFQLRHGEKSEIGI